MAPRPVHLSSATEPVWRRATLHPSLAEDEAHVWRADLDHPAALPPRYESVLGDTERAQAGRFHFEKDRRQFVLSHVVLRQILGAYLSLAPAHLRFDLSARGKPELAPGSNPLHLRFNLSHTHGLALVAVTRRREVGVDVEWSRPVAEATQIAERFFSPQESARLRALPAEQRPAAFFNCWTRREAYLKATGEGIAESPDRIEVTCAPREPARLLGVRGDPQAAVRWQLQELSPGPSYVAALAVKGRGLKVLLWDWSGAPAPAEGESWGVGDR